MFKRPFILFFLVVFCFSCQPKGKYSAAELSTQEQAWAKMMEGHDVVMPLMGAIYQASSQMEKLIAEAAVEANDFHPRAQAILLQLEAADDGMYAWMERIKDNPLKTVRQNSPDHAAVMDFIAQEQESINTVAEAMTSSIKNAEALVKERAGAGL